MTEPKKQAEKIRVLNFSSIDLNTDHQMFADTEDVSALVERVRCHADRPFVYVVPPGKAALATDLVKALKTIRSTCAPYAIFTMDAAQLDLETTQIDIVPVAQPDAATITEQINAYAANRFAFQTQELQVGSGSALPDRVDVTIIGAGITGIYAANRLKDAGLNCVVVEKRDRVGGIWSQFANATSQVNSSECSYRLLEKTDRANRDHSFTREILEDIACLTARVDDRLFLETEVTNIAKNGNGYLVKARHDGKERRIESTGVILAINDRVGPPREIAWPNQNVFSGPIVNGISDGAVGVDWKDKHVVIAGMGAFAIENARTALEAGARHVTVVCRRHGTVCPKIIDYLNFVTPYDETFQHDRKSNIRNMMYWKKLYDLSGATQPECWMGKVKHDGHTISVSDIWFVAHHLKKIETVTGEISDMTADAVVVNGQHHLKADIVVNCIGFERNAPAVAALSGYSQTLNTNYLDKDFMYLADAYIDADAFNSLFGSSVLEMVKFYMEVFVRYFDNPGYEAMLQFDRIEALPVEQRTWSNYIQGAMTLIDNDPRIRELAWAQVDQRTANFLQAHDLKTYVAQNKREWLEMHSLLAGRPMKEEECLPYLFEGLAR